MLGRVKHSKFGHGFAISEHVSGSGRPASEVIFDSNPSVERTMLDGFLSESAEPMPDTAKATKPRKRRTKKEKVERVSDSLLVPELDDNQRLDFSSGFESYTETV